MKSIVCGLSALLCVGFSAVPAAAAELSNDEQKTLYALGVAISQSLGDFALNEAELEIVRAPAVADEPGAL